MLIALGGVDLELRFSGGFIGLLLGGVVLVLRALLLFGGVGPLTFIVFSFVLVIYYMPTILDI